MYGGGVNWRTVDPARYSQVVFVCGPFARGEQMELALIRRFEGCRMIGLNLSMLESMSAWNPFDVALERDSPTTAHPDIVFAASSAVTPVVGVCRIERHDGADTDIADAAINRLTASLDVAVLPIDTRVDINATGLRTPAQIESMIARVDVLITTRLHGLVLALKNGVPAIAIDPKPGGGKITKQARAIG